MHLHRTVGSSEGVKECENGRGRRDGSLLEVYADASDTSHLQWRGVVRLRVELDDCAHAHVEERLYKEAGREAAHSSNVSIVPRVRQSHRASEGNQLVRNYGIEVCLKRIAVVSVLIQVERFDLFEIVGPLKRTPAINYFKPEICR